MRVIRFEPGTTQEQKWKVLIYDMQKKQELKEKYPELYIEAKLFVEAYKKEIFSQLKKGIVEDTN